MDISCPHKSIEIHDTRHSTVHTEHIPSDLALPLDFIIALAGVADALTGCSTGCRVVFATAATNIRHFHLDRGRKESLGVAVLKDALNILNQCIFAHLLLLGSKESIQCVI